ncbi:hypothetical protein ACHAW6_010004 [Cyclotella cf. meneghiniana]
MTTNPLCPRGGSSSTSPPTKKYTSVAQSALETIHSYKSSPKLPPSASSSSPLLLAESALMDKETNAIYWQDVETSDILSTSLTRPYLTQRGVVHVRATVLFAVLWLWVWGNVSRYICRRYFERRQSNFGSALDKLSSSNPILRAFLAIVKPILRFLLLLTHALLYLRPPPYPPELLATTLGLYLLESYGCSTRRYLSHAVNAPKELMEYLESLRSAEPVVKWKVRCFHYEEREVWKWILNGGGGFLRFLLGFMGRSTSGGRVEERGIEMDVTKLGKKNVPPWMTKKVITHQAVGTYKYGSCEDYTLASLWKRAQSFSSDNHGAPFSKLALSKLLVLKDKTAREDYFAQQAAFVMLEGRKDVNAEFATTIEVPGFCPKLLAVRPVPRARNISASLFRLHIYYLFTLLGLSLPYRIWFAKHCDEIRVSVVKETSDSASSNGEKDDNSSSSEAKSSWLRSIIWGTSSPVSSAAVERKRAQELFRKSMQSFSLYEEEPSSMDQNLSHGKEPLNQSSNATIYQNRESNIDLEASIENNDIADDLSCVRAPDATLSTDDDGVASGAKNGISKILDAVNVVDLKPDATLLPPEQST